MFLSFNQKIAFFSLCFLALALPLANHSLVAKDKNDAGKYNPKKDQLITPVTQDIQSKITLAGQIEAEKVAVVKFQTSGYLAWVGVRVGDRVKKGQALASLDKRQLKKNLEKELNDYLTALHDFNDTQDTYQETKEKLLVTDQIQRILDRAQYNLNKAVLDYEIDEIALKYATITSPIDGIVTTIEEPFAGVNITPATAEITVIDPQSLYFSAQIDQEDVIKINQNQKASLSLDIQPDQTIDTQVSYISFLPINGQTTTVYEARFLLPLTNSNLFYRLGMTGDVTITTAQESHALTLPLSAVFEENGQTYTYLKTNSNRLQKQAVTTGIQNDDFIQILEGISKNDQIVIKGS